MRHVVWCSATLSLGAFFYVLTLEPMDEKRTPRAAAMNQTASRATLITQIRRSLAVGQINTAERQSIELLEHHPEDLGAVFYRALAHQEMGQDEEARSRWAVLAQMTLGLESWVQRYSSRQVQYYRAWGLTGLGKTEAARALFAQIADDLEDSSRDGGGEILASGVHYNLACYRSMAGEPERAMSHWRSAIELGYAQNNNDNGWWMVDPDLESLHGDDRFWEIGMESYEHGVRDARERSGGGDG